MAFADATKKWEKKTVMPKKKNLCLANKDPLFFRNSFVVSAKVMYFSFICYFIEYFFLFYSIYQPSCRHHRSTTGSDVCLWRGAVCGCRRRMGQKDSVALAPEPKG